MIELLFLSFFKAKMTKINWLKLVKYDDFMCFFVKHDGKLNIFEFWTVGQNTSLHHVDQDRRLYNIKPVRLKSAVGRLG